MKQHGLSRKASSSAFDFERLPWLWEAWDAELFLSKGAGDEQAQGRAGQPKSDTFTMRPCEFVRPYKPQRRHRLPSLDIGVPFG